MLNYYVLLFFFYSFLGWLLEVIANFVSKKEFVNRGFFIGPYCPIYGCGCLLLILFLGKYVNEPITLFILAVVICSILEYFTSWTLEKIFKMRWWDYSQRKFNIDGRVCLETMVPFGIMGVLVVKYLNPLILKLLSKVSPIVLNIIVIILLVIFAIDFIVSSNIIFNIKSIVKNVKKDSTEEIKKIINKKIKNHLNLYSRLLKSFPNFNKIKINKTKKKK